MRFFFKTFVNLKNLVVKYFSDFISVLIHIFILKGQSVKAEQVSRDVSSDSVPYHLPNEGSILESFKKYCFPETVSHFIPYAGDP